MNKKISSILTFCQGFIIGLGVIFPISASVLAISMGIYKKLIDIINHFSRYLKKEPGFIMAFILGIGASIIVSSLCLNSLMGRFPIATLLFFIGLVLGGLPSVANKVKKKVSFINIIFMLLGIAFISFISLLAGRQNVILSTQPNNLLRLLLAGIIGSGSMIIPGVSGSVMLIILGYYEPLLETISNFLHGIDLFTNMLIIFVFAIGMLLGLLIFAKVINYLLEKYETNSYFVIIGFIIASSLNVVVSLFNYPFKILEFLMGLVFLGIGFMISFKYLKEK